MRSGGYTLHHSLTLEAAAIVKQALSLARRRGHAQVTPLHVASAMLSSPTGLLKRACLQSHSHPLQCKALELCFNVALNRLPTSASSPLLGPLSHLPSLSNALVAAFKRAQAHQRRGSIESQQQPILALKVEIEQLVISILDDPSVSRVMREAGFSSTQVKINVEQAVSHQTTPPPLTITAQSKELTTISTKTFLLGNTSTNTNNVTHHHTTPLINHEVMSVLEAMMNKKTKNTVIVGDCSSTNESIIRGLIDKLDKKEVPHDMKSVQFISVPLFTLKNVWKEEFEVKLGELRALVKSCVGKGIVLYLGDLDWVSGFWSKYGQQRNVFFCAVEYMIMELSRLVCVNSDNKRLWLMGFATFQTYAKCKVGRPSLETLWSLHPLTLPIATNLALTLTLDSGMHDEVKKEAVDKDCNWLFGMKKQLVCCSDCWENFKKEAEGVMKDEKEFITSSSSSSRLPSWLQQYKDDNTKQLQESRKMKDLCKKWNSICSAVHRKPHFLEKVFNISSSSPSSSTSLSSNGHKNNNLKWPTIFQPSQSHLQTFDENEVEVSKPLMIINPPTPKPELLSNPNSSPNSASSSEASHDEDQDHMINHGIFKELNSDNLSHALEKRIPWQKHIIPQIITTVLKSQETCRSCWLFFLGDDHGGKEIAARELAKAVFGSHNDRNFVTIGISTFSSSSSSPSRRDHVHDLTEEVSNKRARNEHGGSVFDRFVDAVRDNPSRVFFIEDVEHFDYGCLKSFQRCMKDGRCGSDHEGVDEVCVKDAIVIFSSERGKREREEEERERSGEPLDLNVATEDGEEDGILEGVDMQVVFNLHQVL